MIWTWNSQNTDYTRTGKQFCREKNVWTWKSCFIFQKNEVEQIIGYDLFVYFLPVSVLAWVKLKKEP